MGFTTKLSVNVNKIATLRNARGNDLPNVETIANDIILFGAHGITVHPRPDERHIKRDDVYTLSKMIREYNTHKNAHIEFNIEGYPSPDFLNLIEETKPDQCTLVPDPPEVITSNAGWELSKNQSQLTEVVQRLKSLKVRSSLFLDPFNFTDSEKSTLFEIKPTRVELYTEKFASDFTTKKKEQTTETYKLVAKQIYMKNIDVNAGHDLNLQNLSFLLDRIPVIKEVSIGHALICESLYKGFKEVVSQYLMIVNRNRS